MLTLVRGLPGSGKSTRAGMIAWHSDATLGVNNMVSADDYMPYPNFDPTLLPICHKRAQERCAKLLDTLGSAVVHNTFTQNWEIQPYLYMAYARNIEVKVISLFDGGLTDKELADRNIHGVPETAIARMRARWEK